MSIVLKGLALLMLFFSNALNAAGVDAASSADEAMVDDEHFPMCEAFVYPNKAEFLFPVLDVATWVWNRKETADKGLEYAWEVLVPSGKPRYGFGAYLFKKAGLKPKEGRISDLIKDADIYAASIELEGNKSNHQIDKELQVTVHLEYEGVVVNLTNAKSVDKVFAKKPKKVVFNLVHPSEIYSITCEAHVVYRIEEPSKQSHPEVVSVPNYFDL